MKRRITLQEIARQAGVSKACVSFVLNGKSEAQKISAETVARVKGIMERTGYRPNHSARALSNGRTGCIAYINGGIYQELLVPMVREAEDKGYKLIAMLTQWDLEKERECVETALGGIVDGMLVGTEVLSADANLAGRLLASEIPALLLSTAPVEGLPALNTDFSSGIAEAVATLVERGHSRIASVCASERHGRWKSVPCEVQCAKFGVEHIAFQYPPEGEKTCASPELCERIIAARPDALIMENARMSLNTLDMLAARGFTPFRDFSAVCIVGEQWIDLCHVPLAVVDYNCAVHARQAVETLVSMLAGARPAPFQQTKTFLRRAEFIAYRNKSKETI